MKRAFVRSCEKLICPSASIVVESSGVLYPAVLLRLENSII